MHHPIRIISVCLAYAKRQGMLCLYSPTNENLEKALAKRFGAHLAFHVVNNDQPLCEIDNHAEADLRSDAVSRVTARLVA